MNTHIIVLSLVRLVRVKVSHGIAYSLNGSEMATPIRLLPISKAMALLLIILLL